MKNIKLHKTKWLFLGILAIPALILSSLPATTASAKEGYGFAVSPMSEKIILNPGDEFESSIDILNPNDYETDMSYKVEVEPYYVDENYQNVFGESYGTNNEMVDWITFQSPTTGRLSPGEKDHIFFTIKVPANAPGGGQYATIMVQGDRVTDSEQSETKEKDDNESTGALKEIKKIAHIIYAEVTGDITRRGEIFDTNVPGFLLNGPIKGASSVRNTGNVHGEAKYKLQIFPLFSGEEIYTTEEKPETHTILPDRTYYNETTWDQTPAIGIFNVVYTVEFEGVTSQVSKMVIICPIWLLFIILFIIALIIIWIVTRFRKHNNKSRRSEQVD